MKTMQVIAVLLGCTCALSPSIDAGESPAVQALLEKVTSEDVEVRYAARSEAPRVGAAAVEALAGLIDEGAQNAGDEQDLRQRQEVAITARAALKNLVHHAGRPGAGDERTAVATELATALNASRSPKAETELLYLIGLVGGDDEVPAVVKRLGDEDPNVSETARLVLERMEGEAALRTLITAARTSDGETKPDLILSLGMKGDERAVPALLELARAKAGSVRFAALKALAHLGAVEALPLFNEALEDENLPERNRLFNEYLRLADGLHAAGHLEEARRVYVAVLADAPVAHQRERALYRASADPRDLQALLAGLSDPASRVRDLALSRLSSLGGKDLLETLLKAYDRAGFEGRVALLRVISERDPSAAEPLLAEAVRSDQPELRLTALDIQDKLDDPSLEATYLEVAKQGSPLVRPVALKGYRLLAGKSLAAGDTDKALRMYGRALELSATTDDRSRALQGLLAVGDPRAIDQVAGLLDDSTLANDAARGVMDLALKMAAAGNQDEAEKRLQLVLGGSFPRDLRHEAAEGLKKIGRDPQKAARDQGFVVNWWVVTPIADSDGKGLEKEFFPETEIVLEGVQRHYGRRFRWQELTEVSLDGRINLLTSFRKTQNVITYAYTTVRSPAEKDVLFKMGSDDGIACWLNGRRIHLNPVARGLQVDQDTVKAHLEKGENRILVKISNGSGDWGFSFRITDPDGKPLNLWDEG